MNVALLTLVFLPPQVVDVDAIHGPIKSIQSAVNSVQGTPGAKIVVHAGNYELAAPIAIHAASKGLTIEAAAGEHPKLIGGSTIKNWHREGNLFVAPVSALIAENGARMLSVGGNLRPRSRVPETGALVHETIFTVPWMGTAAGGWQRKPTDEELHVMKFRAGDIGLWLDPASAEVTVYHMWDESCVGISSVDFDKREIRFSSPTGHPAGAFGVQKYVVWNTKAGLTHPGTWFLDRRSRRIFYYPLPGESAEDLIAIVPSTNQLISVEGAEDVTIKGLDLSVTNVSLISAGFGAGNYDGAITGVNCARLRLQDLSIRSVAGIAIRVWNSPDGVVSRCQVSQTGAGGIRFDGDRATVEDCSVSHIGIQYPSAIGIWVNGVSSVVTHNEVTDTSYTAIIGGGNSMTISNNYIARAMLDLHDGGGIYTSACSGVTIKGNLIEKIVDTGGYGASAYYLDENTHDSKVIENVSSDVARPTHNHLAQNNTLSGNLFCTAGDMALSFPRSERYHVVDNVFSSGGKIELKTPPNGIETLFGNSFRGTSFDQVRLDLYAEKERTPIIVPKSTLSPRSIEQIGPRTWKVVWPGGREQTWDMTTTGPRNSR